MMVAEQHLSSGPSSRQDTKVLFTAVIDPLNVLIICLAIISPGASRRDLLLVDFMLTMTIHIRLLHLPHTQHRMNQSQCNPSHLRETLRVNRLQPSNHWMLQPRRWLLRIQTMWNCFTNREIIPTVCCSPGTQKNWRTSADPTGFIEMNYLLLGSFGVIKKWWSELLFICTSLMYIIHCLESNDGPFFPPPYPSRLNLATRKKMIRYQVN